MGAPKGNTFALNNKGGGRKSAYKEKLDADLLWKTFINKYTKEEVSKLIKGKHSIKDAWIVKAFEGNERFIQQIVQKLFPDKQEVKHSGSISLKELSRVSKEK